MQLLYVSQENWRKHVLTDWNKNVSISFEMDKMVSLKKLINPRQSSLIPVLSRELRAAFSCSVENVVLGWCYCKTAVLHDHMIFGQ